LPAEFVFPKQWRARDSLLDLGLFYAQISLHPMTGHDVMKTSLLFHDASSNE